MFEKKLTSNKIKASVERATTFSSTVTKVVCRHVEINIYIPEFSLPHKLVDFNEKSF